jgi:hypothetical protein
MTWLFNLIPIWVWIVAGIVAAIFAYRMLGWKGMVAVAAVTFGSVAYSRGVKTGTTSERAKQAKADVDAVVIIQRERDEAEGLTETELDQEFNRWNRG